MSNQSDTKLTAMTDIYSKEDLKEAKGNSHISLRRPTHQKRT